MSNIFNNINVLIRIDKDKVEELKKIAEEISLKNKINISYNELITQAVYEKYPEK